MSVTDEHRMSPSKVLAKKKSEKKPDDDKDDKKGADKGTKRNALIDFIAKSKKHTA